MTDSFKDLQAKWYAILKAKGFEDIENTKNENRPLKEWHSLKGTSHRFQIIQANRTSYQRQVDSFLNHPSFIEACEAIIKPGARGRHSTFTVSQVQTIWELHAEGLTRRRIARRMGRAKSRIDDVIEGLRELMNLL